MSLSLLAGYGSSDEEDENIESDVKDSTGKSPSDTGTQAAEAFVEPQVKKVKLPSALDLLSGKSSSMFSSGPFVCEFLHLIFRQ